MGEWQNLSGPHAVLKIGLSDGAYSHSSTRAPAEGIPEWKNGRGCQSGTRRWKLACQKVHALPCCA